MPTSFPRATNHEAHRVSIRPLPRERCPEAHRHIARRSPRAHLSLHLGASASQDLEEAAADVATALARSRAEAETLPLSQDRIFLFRHTRKYVARMWWNWK